jgi:hypothetical protein
MIDPVDIYDATPPAPNLDADVNPGSVLDENPTQSSLADNSILSCSANDASPIVGRGRGGRRSRGRPRRQIPVVETHPLQNEPKRKLRSQKPAGADRDDPWVMLSKAPLLTPLSPKKPLKAPTQKAVNDPSCCPYNYLLLTMFQTGEERELPQKRDAQS